MSEDLVERVSTATEQLEASFASHGYQMEDMQQEYLRIRRNALSKIDEEFEEADAEFDVRCFLSTDEKRRAAANKLAMDSTSPIVSKQTQMAVLKQLIQDYFRNKKRPGLTALTALKAVELLNKMTGYDAPIEQTVSHEHKVIAMPVAQEVFKGELPPLDVIDIPDENYNNNRTTIAHIVAEDDFGF